MNKLKLHEFESLSKSAYGAFDRVAVPGGWVYRVWNFPSDADNDSGYAAMCFVPSPRAPHARDRRRLKLRDGVELYQIQGELVTLWRDPDMVASIVRHSTHSFTARHADGSETDHATRLEAHDALVESGSPSPFKVVKGSAVEPTPDAA